MMPFVRRLTRDPLFWFVVAGTSFFLLYRTVTRSDATVEVARAVQISLAADSRLLTGHEPDSAARQKLIDDYVADEVLFREAIKRGLHLADPQIKKRLVDRMRFLLVGDPAEPTEADLLAFYSDHTAVYRSEPATTFDQLPGSVPPFEDPAPPRKDPAPQGRRFTRYGDSMLRSIYGQEFVDSLKTLTSGQWSGPIKTSQGDVFIRVLDRFPEAMLDYASIRDQVREDWLANKNDTAIRKAVASMEHDYAIHIEK
jgi:peptidyl-prolyl cis-trans isomerase C